MMLDTMKAAITSEAKMTDSRNEVLRRNLARIIQRRAADVA
jgi:hypothetical protein